MCVERQFEKPPFVGHVLMKTELSDITNERLHLQLPHLFSSNSGDLIDRTKAKPVKLN